uniref:6-phosphogluconolactonase n=1 Tax=Ditylum brightwellii TaxID=49249 RepID=A0A6S9AA96_9STRA|mmetsp:Transcript_10945/g.15870  ORF Transcript_10945/g.15870 Transcript_10945/m.15870 type:complete len:358 (-) Transcript_10945:199-1272(-)
MTHIPFYVGSYTQIEGHVPRGRGKGIYAYLLNNETGELVRASITTGMTNPTYILFDEKAGLVYAVEEKVGTQGHLRLYSVNFDGSLMEISRQPTLGFASCHISRCGSDHVVVANYASGNAASFATGGGKLEPGVCVSYTGSGPVTERQEGSHAHHSVTSPDGKWIFVCDLGSDKIWCHAATMPLSQPRHSTSTPPGSGPRHLVFHPVHPMVYVICELAGFLLVCNYDAEHGNLSITSAISCLPPNYEGTPSSACIRMHPSGEAVYLSNRGHDSIAIFAINTTDGSLKNKTGNPEWFPCGGAEPRDFAIDPTGRWLVVGNQNGNTLTVFNIISPCHVDYGRVRKYSCDTPACIAFSQG